jgi:hypothetical protein
VTVIKRRFLRVGISALVMLSGCSSESSPPMGGQSSAAQTLGLMTLEHRRLVAATAFALVNPDYEIWSPEDQKIVSRNGVTDIPVMIRSRPAAYPDSDEFNARPDRIRIYPSGDISFPVLPVGSATKELLRVTGTVPYMLQSRRVIAKTLNGLDHDTTRTTVLFEFTDSMNEAQMKKESLEAQIILLPLQWQGKTLGWDDASLCHWWEPVDCGTPMKQFQKWVSQLRETDEAYLPRGLKLEQLRSVAEGARVVGVLADGIEPMVAQEMLRNTHVRAAYLIDFGLKRPIP